MNSRRFYLLRKLRDAERREVDSDEGVRIVHEIDKEAGLMTNTEHILAIDPGETTGLAWCSMDRVLGVDGSPLDGPGERDERYHHLFEWGEITGSIGQQARKIVKGMIELRARILIAEVSDHFLLSPQGKRTLRKSSLVPVKLVGALEAIVSLFGAAEPPDDVVGIAPIVLVQQTPSQAKTVITKEVLTAFGFPAFGRGKEMSAHEIDATRHLLLFIRRMYASAGNERGFASSVVEGLRR